MNILTFDIEDWYCHDNISGDMEWSKFESRIEENVDKILEELSNRNQKATFFCLGWLAEHKSATIKCISDNGHQIGCHSYQHELASRFDAKGFKEDTYRAKSSIEDLIGKSIELYRAPAFSITPENPYAIEVLAELGFTTDCSIFPSMRDFGGMPNFGVAEPVIIEHNGIQMKEFPMNISTLLGRNIIFSGGGYFRLLPYALIKKLTTESSYVMTYFHPSDFDFEQPSMPHLPKLRQWKNQVGLKSAFDKLKKYLDDFEFINLDIADSLIDWKTRRIIKI